jgi:linoleoyl-CoA desaturase
MPACKKPTLTEKSFLTMSRRFLKYNPAEKSIFYREARSEVNIYLEHKGTLGLAGTGMKLKIIFCICCFAFTYSQYLNAGYSYPQWLVCCVAMGISSMLVGINIGHDAVHQALFAEKKWNDLAGFSFDLIGISSYTWKLKHNIVHHRFPNVTAVDFDIEASPFLRLSPADKWYPYHRFQHLYAPIVYILFSLNLVLLNDLTILVKIKREDIDGQPHPRFILQKVLLYKLCYLSYMLVLPIIVLPFLWWQVITGFVLMHIVLSLLLSLVLLPSHLFENTRFSSGDAAGILNEDWAIHQMNTTLDFASGNTVINFLFGGFNTNVVHHLFPGICHYYYKPLTRIIKRKAEALNVNYNHTTLAGAIHSHFRALKKLGSRQTFVNET